MKREIPAARPGLEALERAIKQAYPLQEALLFRTPDDCQSLLGILIYRGDPNRSGPHWHFVTMGLTELFGKESDNRQVSGWGFELTLKVPRLATDETPPAWPADLLLFLAETVFETQHIIEPGQILDLMNPLLPESRLSALMFAPDELGIFDSPNGRALFLQAIGLTADELEVTRNADPLVFLTLLDEKHPGLLTVPDRGSILDDESVRTRMAEAAKNAPSPAGICYADYVGWQQNDGQVELTVGEEAWKALADALNARIKVGQPWLCLGEEERNDSAVTFLPADKDAWSVDVPEGGAPLLVIRLSMETVDKLAAEMTSAGELSPMPGLLIRKRAS